MPLSAGDKLGPYEILSRLGAGGMEEVWKARDTRLDRIVAVKISQSNFDERFEREARSIAALNHPNICQLHDVGPNYLVMEFVEGSPIARADGVRKLLDLAVQIADGLAAAHAGGILHRDLKPENILATSRERRKLVGR
jgi:serine/threonine protein kinase